MNLSVYDYYSSINRKNNFQFSIKGLIVLENSKFSIRPVGKRSAHYQKFGILGCVQDGVGKMDKVT
jgi:hypothetical protein